MAPRGQFSMARDSSGTGGTKRAPSCSPLTCRSWTAPTCAGSDPGTQGDTGQHSPEEPARRSPERASRTPGWPHRVPARLQDGPRGDRVEATRLPLSFGPVAGLAEIQEPGGAGRDTRSGRGLEHMSEADCFGARFEVLLMAQPNTAGTPCVPRWEPQRSSRARIPIARLR